MFNRKILQYLSDWINAPKRKPLILRGARQVGKTSAVVLFAQQKDLNLIHLNLEHATTNRYFQKDLSLSDFESVLKVNFGYDINKPNTLIFLDEIQNSKPLISLLRFFYEERPELNVIAAGSLLETKIKDLKTAFPVGRVQFAYMYPLDFFEYLEATKEKRLLKFLENYQLSQTIPDGIHLLATQKFTEYSAVGGMPEIIASLGDEERMKDIYKNLITSFHEDIPKYSDSKEAKVITHLLDEIPSIAGTTTTYETLNSGNFKSTDVVHALSTLEGTMLTKIVYATNSISLPIKKQPRRPKKFIFLDVGLVHAYTETLESIWKLKASSKTPHLSPVYKGRIAEQIVAQNIMAHFESGIKPIYYWARLKDRGTAEVDFCMVHKDKVLGIEVKSGKGSTLKSLLSFSNAVGNSVLVRVHTEPPQKELIGAEGKKHKLVSIPFYLVPKLFSLIG